MSAQLNSAEALEALRGGERLLLRVGPGAGDPVLLVWMDGEVVESESIGGWSAGVRELVCHADSFYLIGYLSNRYSLTVDTESRI